MIPQHGDLLLYGRRGHLTHAMILVLGEIDSFSSTDYWTYRGLKLLDLWRPHEVGRMKLYVAQTISDQMANHVTIWRDGKVHR